MCWLMKRYFLLLGSLLPLTLFYQCTNPNANLSPGPGDPRVIGTWQLVERHYPKDSVKTVLTINRITRRDSIVVTVGGKPVKKDTLITRVDTLFVRRDTSFYKTQYYPATPAQTLRFESDGKLGATGSEMSYYRAYPYYRVDRTYPDSLLIDLLIRTNGATSAVRQGLTLRSDSLIINHRCDYPCYSKFRRVP